MEVVIGLGPGQAAGRGLGRRGGRVFFFFGGGGAVEGGRRGPLAHL